MTVSMSAKRETKHTHVALACRTTNPLYSNRVSRIGVCYVRRDFGTEPAKKIWIVLTLYWTDVADLTDDAWICRAAWLITSIDFAGDRYLRNPAVRCDTGKKKQRQESCDIQELDMVLIPLLVAVRSRNGF